MKPDSFENFRKTAMSLADAVENRDLKGITFAAPAIGQGTTTAILNVAQQLRDSFRIAPLTVELSTHNPDYAKRFELDAESSIEAIGAGKKQVAACIQRSPTDLLVIPSDGSGRLAVALDGLRRVMEAPPKDYRVVLVDAPPILATVDAMIAGKVTGSIVLVIASGRVTYEALERILRDLDTNQVRLLGAVLNKQKRYTPGWLYRMLR